MPEIPGFTVEKQAGKVFCWAAACRSVLLHYNPTLGNSPNYTQQALVAQYGSGTGNQTGKPHKLLMALGLFKGMELFNGDPSLQIHASRLGWKILEAINRGEPVIVSFSPLMGGTGHSMVIFGYDTVNGSCIMADPARPQHNVTASLSAMLVSFEPYPGLVNISFHIERLTFTARPTRMFW